MSIMSYKQFNENSSNINIEEKWEEIKSKWSEEDVISAIDESIPDYLDSDWEDEYDSEYDAYQEQGRGEAEDVVINQIFQSVGITYNQELYDRIVDYYDISV